MCVCVSVCLPAQNQILYGHELINTTLSCLSHFIPCHHRPGGWCDPGIFTWSASRNCINFLGSIAIFQFFTPNYCGVWNYVDELVHTVEPKRDAVHWQLLQLRRQQQHLWNFTWNLTWSIKLALVFGHRQNEKQVLCTGRWHGGALPRRCCCSSLPLPGRPPKLTISGRRCRSRDPSSFRL